MTLAPASVRGFLVPDAAHWAAAGIDIRALGIDPVADASGADLMVLPASVPPGLEDAVREARLRLRDRHAIRVLEQAPSIGVPTAEVLAERPENGHQGGHEDDDGGDDHDRHEHEDHHGHDHHGDHEEMMAVTGEPSSDGLVMEDAEAVVGPLGPALATGLVWRATLDGDVVCDSRIDSVLTAPAAEDGASAPLARAAWRWARERAAGGPTRAQVPWRLAAVEIERALSHTMWLARLSWTLGVAALADRLLRAASPLIQLHAELLRDADARPDPHDFAAVRGALAAARSSGGLRGRTRAVGIVSAAECRERGVRGPVARAAELHEDVRRDDPAYDALGFGPAVDTAGDAEARAAVRIDEALASLELAARALEAAELPVGEGAVEGPRGPVVAKPGGSSGAIRFVAPGAAAARELAAASACGHELARAVVAVSSFDLDPWAVER